MMTFSYWATLAAVLVLSGRFALCHAGGRVQIGGLARVGSKTGDWPQFASRHGKLASFAFESHASQVDGVIQFEDACVDHQVIEERIIHIEVMLRLQVACAVT